MPLLIVLPLLVLALGACALSWWSHRSPPDVGLSHGRLRDCPATPNCVSSETGAPAQAMVTPWEFSDQPAAAWARARVLLLAAGGRIERETENYLWATFRTPLLRFVDDLELRLDSGNLQIHVRSASRVGRSDLGQNRRRVEALRARFVASMP